MANCTLKMGSARFQMDAGILQFESMSQRYDADGSGCGGDDSNCEGWSRHIRVLAEGAVSHDGELTKVDHIQSLYSEIDNNSDKVSSEDDRITFASARGTEGVGYITTLQYAVGNPNSIETLSNEVTGRSYHRCYTESGKVDCAGSKAITLETPESLGFLMHPNSPHFVDGNSWFESGAAYLTFTQLEAKGQQ